LVGVTFVDPRAAAHTSPATGLAMSSISINSIVSDAIQL
jgi:hypothetical protein